MRDVFGAAWPLFQVCLPTCLPLAVLAIVAGGAPGAEARATGELHGFSHGRDWWGVTIASSLLVLICYGALLRQQLGFAAGERPQLMQSLRDAGRDIPAVLVLIVAWTLPFLPAIAVTAWRGFDGIALVLTAIALGVLVYGLPAWPLLLARGVNPFAALAASARMVRGRWLQFAGIVLALLGGVLVFALLSSILISMVMNLAGQGSPTANGLAFSRWLIALVLAVPVVYAGAVSVVTWRVASRNG